MFKHSGPSSGRRPSTDASNWKSRTQQTNNQYMEVRPNEPKQRISQRQSWTTIGYWLNLRGPQMSKQQIKASIFSTSWKFSDTVSPHSLPRLNTRFTSCTVWAAITVAEPWLAYLSALSRSWVEERKRVIKRERGLLRDIRISVLIKLEKVGSYTCMFWMLFLEQQQQFMYHSLHPELSTYISQGSGKRFHFFVS